MLLVCIWSGEVDERWSQQRCFSLNTILSHMEYDIRLGTSFSSVKEQYEEQFNEVAPSNTAVFAVV